MAASIKCCGRPFKGVSGGLCPPAKTDFFLKKTIESIEIEKYSKYLKDDYIINSTEKSIQILTKKLTTGKRDMLISNICFINSIVKKVCKKRKNLN